MTALIAYASTHGHTAKIAERLAAALALEGAEAELADLGHGASPAPHRYDAVVVMASVHAGNHQRSVIRWAERHALTLTEARATFVSVSLTAAGDTPGAAAATLGFADTFAEQTGWTPERVVPLAGALQYREYGFLVRLLMRTKMAKGGHPTDTSRDYEFTDWEAVDALAREIAAPRSAVADRLQHAVR